MTVPRYVLRAAAPLLGVALLCVLALVPLAPLRAAVAVPLALTVPGYALTQALPRLGVTRDVATSLSLSIVLSLASYPLLGLLLYAAGIRISEASVLAALEAEVLVATAVGLTVRRVPARDHAHGATPTSLGRSQVLMLAAPIVALVAIPVGLRHLLPPAARPPFSQLYLLGDQSRTAGLVTVWKRLVVDVGARNETGGERRYTLLGRLDGRAAVPLVGFVSPNGGVWARRVTVIVPKSPCAHRVQLVLRDDGRRRDVASVDVWAIRAGAGRCGGGG